MLSGEGDENGEKTTAGLLSKKATLLVQHTFFVVLNDYNVKLPEISTYTFMEEMSYVFLLTIFFTAAHFHLQGRYHFSFSHRRYKIFMLFFQQKMSHLLFISHSSSLPLFSSLSFPSLSPTFSFSLSLSLLYIPSMWT